ncbi:MAG: PQQ-binding-like beta-propeller repeat protein [Myxococcales bacterium]|nr:PQQ-binding-like beta-propeller repeat protein [Myxococcales bacterium]
MQKTMMREIGFADLEEVGGGLQLWKVETGDVTASALEGTHALLGRTDGTLQSVASHNGKASWTSQVSSLPIAGIKIHQSRCVVWDRAGGVVLCELGKGKVLARYDLGGDLVGEPLCVGEWIVLASVNGSLCRIDAENGAVAWQTRFHEGLRLAPVCSVSLAQVFEQGQGLLLGSVSLTGRLLVWDAATGHLVSSRHCGLLGAVSIHALQNADFFVVEQSGQGSLWSFRDEASRFVRDTKHISVQPSSLAGVVRCLPQWLAGYDMILGSWGGELVRRYFDQGRDLWRVKLPDRLLSCFLLDWEVGAFDYAGTMALIDSRTGQVKRSLRLPSQPASIQVGTEGGLLVSDASGGLTAYRAGWWKSSAGRSRSFLKRTASSREQDETSAVRKKIAVKSDETSNTVARKAQKKGGDQGDVALWYNEWFGSKYHTYENSWLRFSSAQQGIARSWQKNAHGDLAMRTTLALDILDMWDDEETPERRKFWLAGFGTLGVPEVPGLLERLCAMIYDFDLSEFASRVLVSFGTVVLPSLWAEITVAGLASRMLVERLLLQIAEDHPEVDLHAQWTERSQQVLFHPDAAMRMLEMLLAWPNLSDAQALKMTMPLRGICPEPTPQMEALWEKVQARYPSLKFNLFAEPEEGEGTFFSAEQALKKAEKRFSLKAEHSRGDAADTNYFPDRSGPMGASPQILWSGAWSEKIPSKNTALAGLQVILSDGTVFLLNYEDWSLSAWKIGQKAKQGLEKTFSMKVTDEITTAFVVWGESLLLRGSRGGLSQADLRTGETFWKGDEPRESNLLVVHGGVLYSCREINGKWKLLAEERGTSLKRLWECELGNDRPHSMIVTAQGRLMLNFRNGSFLCVDNGDGSILYRQSWPELGACWMIGAKEGILYASQFGAYGAIDEMGFQLWRGVVDSNILGAPAYANGRMYVSTQTGELLYVDAQSGTTQSTYKAWGPLWGPVVAGKAVYVCDTEGQVYALHQKVNEELWRIQLGEKTPSHSPLAWEKKLIVFDQKGKMYVIA